jgi:hypothetical protein
VSRKLVVLIVLTLLLGLAGLPTVVALLDRIGLIACARWARAEYVILTSAAERASPTRCRSLRRAGARQPPIRWR